MDLTKIKIRKKRFFLMGSARITLFGNIVVSNDQMKSDFNEIISSLINRDDKWPKNVHFTKVNLFLHELTHLIQLQEMGVFLFIVNFLRLRLHDNNFRTRFLQLVKKKPVMVNL